MNFVVIDPLMQHLSAMSGQHINDAVTMQRFALLHPDTVFTLLAHNNQQSKEAQQWELCGVESMVTPKRLDTFRTNMKCVDCGCVGNAFLVERHKNDNQHQYLNLYCIEPGSIKLMTVDHILPDCLGGRYDAVNFQTMCRACNLSKRNLMSLAEIDQVRQRPQQYAKTWVHLPFLHAILDLQELIQDATGKQRALLLNIFDSYRKRVKFGTKLPEATKVTVALLKAIEESDPNFKEQSCTNVPVVAVPDSIKGSWSARMKRWFASVAEALGSAHTAVLDLRAGRRSQG